MRTAGRGASYAVTGLIVRGTTGVVPGARRFAPAAGARVACVAAAHDCVRRRHASTYFSDVLVATSGGRSGPGAVLSQSSVSR